MKKLLEKRGKIYGDFLGGVMLHSNIMSLIKNRHIQVHKHKMNPILELCVSYIVNKLIRIAVSPSHIDSWRDISGYATLTMKYLKGDDDAD